jgi:hypothetical protein
MSTWIALSDRRDPAPDPLASMACGLFVLEFALPILAPAVLLQTRQGGTLFSIFFDPQAGLSILHRQGDTLRRHLLAGPIEQRQGTARLSFTFEMARQVWGMELSLPDQDHPRRARGTGPLPLLHPILHALCSGAPRHPAVLWFGATDAADLPKRAPWIGLNTPVDTRRGPTRAGLLKPGDMVATLDDGFQPLQRLIHHSLPSRGSFAPVILRSPFFGLTTDILVSADQMVLISGPSVEYLYGVEEALLPAAALCDNRVAVRDDRRALTQSVSLDFGQPQAVVADGCCLLSAHDGITPLPRLALREAEARPLLLLLGRTAVRHLA